MWLAVLSLGLGAFAYLHHAHGEGALWVISGLGFAMTSARAWQLKRFPRDHREQSHLARLEEAGYVESTKGFRGKIPFTHYR
jgi:hypothetical protein